MIASGRKKSLLSREKDKSEICVKFNG